MNGTIRHAHAGTLESSDAYVEIAPREDGQKGIELELESPVLMQFGDEIRESVLEMLKRTELESAWVRVVDRGALDCVIRARVETAAKRAKGE